MTISQIFHRAEKVISDNSPAILTAVGVTGTVTTAYLTGKATFKAAKIIRDEQFKLNLHETKAGDRLETKEKVELVWKLYIPAASVCSLSIVAIVGANRIGTRRAAAVAAAYSLSERAFSEYKEKVIEKIGEKKEEEVRTEIAQDHVNHSYDDRQVIFTGTGEVLCHDAFSDRYFQSTMETLKKAQNDINYRILKGGEDSASLTEFYNKVGLNKTSISDDVGWNTDKLLELHFASVLTPDQKPCISMDFATVPMHDFWRYQ